MNKFKKIIPAIITVILSVFILSCNFIPNYNSYIYIYDCEHGRIEVELKEEEFDKDRIYYICAYPEAGYELKQENIFVVINSESKSKYQTSKSVYKSENTYYIYVYRNEKITISAIFTKIQ